MNSEWIAKRLLYGQFPTLNDTYVHGLLKRYEGQLRFRLKTREIDNRPTKWETVAVDRWKCRDCATAQVKQYEGRRIDSVNTRRAVTEAMHHQHFSIACDTCGRVFLLPYSLATDVIVENVLQADLFIPCTRANLDQTNTWRNKISSQSKADYRRKWYTDTLTAPVTLTLTLTRWP